MIYKYYMIFNIFLNGAFKFKNKKKIGVVMLVGLITTDHSLARSDY